MIGHFFTRQEATSLSANYLSISFKGPPCPSADRSILSLLAPRLLPRHPLGKRWQLVSLDEFSNDIPLAP